MPESDLERPLLFHSAEQVLTLAGPAEPRRSQALANLGILRNAAVLTAKGRIATVGTWRALRARARRLGAEPVDCSRRVIMPGFVDPHTHPVFAGNRVNDFEQRLHGTTYEQIAARGGGIRYSARLLRRASREQLIEQAGGFLRQCAAYGTTTIEVKTGYGLDLANERKMLEVIQALKERSPLELVPTLLALHAVPARYEGRTQLYINRVIRHWLPEIGRLKSAEFLDCFCERGAFGVEDCRRLLSAARTYGLIPRVHAEQLSHTGGCRLAVEVGAASADHLDHVNQSDIRALAGSKVIATLLPGANFHLGLKRYPPARELIAAGAAVALATDFNPGTSPNLNMQFVLSLACSAMRMTPAEAVSAATINAAQALRRGHRIGSLEPGKQADLIVMDVRDYREIPYYFGWNHCVMTVKRGRIIWGKQG